MIGHYPVLILGPTNRGRSYGVVGRSEHLGIGETQITHLSIINHDLVDYLRPGDRMVSQFRIPGTENRHFLSCSTGLPPIEGNVVVVTNGLILTSEDVDRHGQRLPLLARNVFDGLSERATPRMAPLAIDWAKYAPGTAAPKAALRLFGGLLEERRLRLCDSTDPADPRHRSELGLSWIGELLALLPPGRATDLTWSTSPVKLANWNIALSDPRGQSDPGEPGGVSTIDIMSTPKGAFAVRAAKAPRPLVETEAGWLALIDGLTRLADTTAEHGKTLDHFRSAKAAGADPAGCIAARCKALLRHVGAAVDAGAQGEWLTLLARAAAQADTPGLAVDLRQIVRGLIATTLADDGTGSLAGSDRERIVERLLAGGSDGMFAQLGAQPGELVALACLTADPLRFWDSIPASAHAALVSNLAAGWESNTTASAPTLFAIAALLTSATDAERRSETIAAALRQGCTRLRDIGGEWTELPPGLQRQLAESLPRLGGMAYAYAAPLAQREAIRVAADRLSALLPAGAAAVQAYRRGLLQAATRQIEGATRNAGYETTQPDRMALFDAMTSHYRIKLAHLAKNHRNSGGEVVR